MKTWVIALLVELLRALLGGLVKNSLSTSEDAARQPELKRRLQRKVRRAWPSRAIGILGVLALVVALGCEHVRTVYVPEGEPVRLRATVRDADVWVKDVDGKTVPGRLDLLEGWYCLSLEEDEEVK